MIFDSHAHYDDEAFDADREEVLAGLKEQGVGTVVNVGASIASTKTTLALAEAHPFMYAAVGSYIARVQRIFHIRVRRYPPLWTTWVLAAAIFTYRSALRQTQREGWRDWLPKTLLGAVLFGFALSFQIKANHQQITYYLALMIVFVSSKIVVGRRTHQQGMYIDLQTLAEMEQERDRLEREVRERQRQEEIDWRSIRNQASNENALNEKLRDDRGTNAAALNEAAAEAEARMRANRDRKSVV